MPRIRKVRKQAATAPPLVTNPDQAWKALSLVVDWIRHAEAKAAATLASSGVVATILYNLVKEQSNPPFSVAFTAVACGSLVSVAATCAGIALRPRLRSKEEPTSTLYYHHIARKYTRGQGSGLYIESLKSLTADSDQLVAEIASQVWANAHVARDKYRWGNYGLMSLLLAIPSLVATVLALHFASN
ncbi:Pycsar system effector family protein [Streptomyces sp. NPDC001500]